MRGHDTKKCRHLYEAWLASTSDGRTEVEPPKPKTTKNSKSWSKSKDKKKKSNEKKKKTPLRQMTATNRIMTRSQPPTKRNQKLGERFSKSEPHHPQRQHRRTIYVIHSTKNRERRSKASLSPTPRREQ
ncbi:hypothetical protein DY000_02041025 [Brassica cretica]|nr:hypothetical protein DY000_02041025 [Brassica cretica]